MYVSLHIDELKYAAKAAAEVWVLLFKQMRVMHCLGLEMQRSVHADNSHDAFFDLLCFACSNIELWSFVSKASPQFLPVMNQIQRGGEVRFVVVFLMQCTAYLWWDGICLIFMQCAWHISHILSASDTSVNNAKAYISIEMY